ncbi:MAG: hypothetical protein CMF41_06370 [Legionellales bacterium]|nr:hypothetical protein [Legionellales bacterium]OUX64208.1 MAG: hypothetical protein CBE41_03915 [Gammaproteobacteria bacterium TMED281]|tara:strand:- start:241 stop:1554 length:1314 start_codon:yes stop_codon:yes gene_type:complete
MHSQSTPKTNEIPLQLAGIFMVALGTTFYIYEFFIRVIPSVISVELMHEFSISASLLGVLSSGFYYAYTFMQIPSGLLCDRYGPKVLLVIGITLCGIATFLFGMTQSSFMIGFSRMACGAASAFAFICPLVLTTHWFPSKYFALVTGVIQTMGCLGAIFGGHPLATLVSEFGWRSTLIYSGYVGVFIGLIIYLFLQNKPDSDEIFIEPNACMSDDHNNTTEWQRLKKIITKRQNWHIALTGFCCWGPIAVFAELWGIQYIHHDLGLSIDLAAVQLLWVWVGIAIMSPIVGWWSDNIQSRKTPILICFSIGLLATLLLILPEKASLWTLDITMFLLGTSAGIQPITFGLIREQNSQTVAGTAIAFNNMAVIFGGVILQPLFGFLLDFFWQGSLLNGVRMYGIFEYQHAMWILPFCCLIGFFNTLWFVDETNCQRIDVS